VCLRVCVRACVCVFVCVCARVGECVCVCVCARVLMCASECLFACRSLSFLSACVSIYACLCVCVYIYACLCVCAVSVFTSEFVSNECLQQIQHEKKVEERGDACTLPVLATYASQTRLPNKNKCIKAAFCSSGLLSLQAGTCIILKKRIKLQSKVFATHSCCCTFMPARVFVCGCACM